MSPSSDTTAPRYMGGQAVMEGVMMRGQRTWAVAVRTPEGDIEIETHEAPTGGSGGRRSRCSGASWRSPSR